MNYIYTLFFSLILYFFYRKLSLLLHRMDPELKFDALVEDLISEYTHEFVVVKQKKKEMKSEIVRVRATTTATATAVAAVAAGILELQGCITDLV